MNSKEIPYYWIRIVFVNLLLVATLGVVLRYKIAFYLPFIEQKHILHAHSHFAFAGWITQVLMLLLIRYLLKQSGTVSWAKYKWLLLANLICAYGMLLSFPVQGYGTVSIAFSTISIIVSYVFALSYWRDLNLLPFRISHYWFKAALIFSVVSSFGTFALSAMMITRTIHQNWYLAAIYFYLHFQYNGWFFFTCMGLLFTLIAEFVSLKNQKLIFWLFALACVPAYVLSALWLPIPEWVHATVTIAALLQIVGWGILVRIVFKNTSRLSSLLGAHSWIFILPAITVTIKLLLQLGSTIHFLSDLAFGFRPIVVGYLHLVLLGVITLSIIGYLLTQRLIIASKNLMAGVLIFIVGIILNELVLMLQGITAITYIGLPYINEVLFGVTLIMFSGVLAINIALRKSK